MSDIDPAHLLADLQINGIDFRQTSRKLAQQAGILIAREIGSRAARREFDSNVDGYDPSISPDENLVRLQNFALQNYHDEENELYKNGWFSEHQFSLGVMQGYTGIDMRSGLIQSALAESYWDTTQTLLRAHEAENVPSTEARF